MASEAALGSLGSNKIAVLSPLPSRCRSIQFSVILSCAPSNQLTFGVEKSQSKTRFQGRFHEKLSLAIVPQKVSGSSIDVL